MPLSFSAKKISYRTTNSFSSLVYDYLDADDALRPFYSYEPSLSGIEKSIEARKNFKVNRQALAEHFSKQYSGVETSNVVLSNIQLLENENTFTVCTAHQPNIFTGHLYFIYKILHSIKLAADLSKHFPLYQFVPVYYMGNEDADLAELGEVTIKGHTYHWKTEQKGAVGKMMVDDALIKMLDSIAGQLLVDEHGEEILQLLQRHYVINKTIEDCTFTLVNELFKDYGLLVLIPDSKQLKEQFLPTSIKELSEGFSNKAVENTLQHFPSKYKVQTYGRDINLFYLKDGLRSRIENASTGFQLTGTGITLSAKEIVEEFKANPERISPNVILRPLYQELILPNIAFIGGGGELAYWLELKSMFDKEGVLFPALVLRNSFTIVEQGTASLMDKSGLSTEDMFASEKKLLDAFVLNNSDKKLSLEKEINELTQLYTGLAADASAIDITLQKHVKALQAKAIAKVEVLQKKMLAAEKRNQEANLRKLKKARQEFFPNEALQERVNNIFSYLSKYGIGFIDVLYNNSGSLTHQFTILTEE